MPVLSLQKIVIENLSAKDIGRMHFSEKGVMSRIFIECVKESTTVEMFKEAVAQNNGHVCKMQKFDVWHGSLIGPRKFRNKTLCKCVCDGLGKLCKCECGAAIKMLVEFRENEVFRGYGPGQTKHKKARRFIPKRTRIKELISNQFHDPHPYQRH